MRDGRKSRIFVGSSTEGMAQAEAICRLLTDEHSEAVLWTREFPAGYVTIEGLEMVLTECSGAVFVATPDDETMFRDRRVKIPRANVMLEFGLLAGRFGRHNVAICRYPPTELPSDLKGLTVIDMEPSKRAGTAPEGEATTVSLPPEAALTAWRSGILATADKIERTTVVHGYTGAWDFEITLERWRGLTVSGESYVTGSGTAHLYLDVTGSSGTGLVKGSFGIRLCGDSGCGQPLLLSELRFCHEVIRAHCDQGGELQLTTRIFTLHHKVEFGEPPAQVALMGDLPAPWSFEWTLGPSFKPRTLEGSLEARNPGTTKGTIHFVKRA